VRLATDEFGGLFDFWAFVRSQRDIVEVRWMRMDDVLDGLRTQANRRQAEGSGSNLRDQTRDPGTAPTKSVEQ
jgi:hypothetical protein